MLLLHVSAQGVAYYEKRVDEHGIRRITATGGSRYLSSAYASSLGHDDWPAIDKRSCCEYAQPRVAAQTVHREYKGFPISTAIGWAMVPVVSILKRVAGLRQADMLRLGGPPRRRLDDTCGQAGEEASRR